MAKMFDLSGKVALVTGSSRGIGKAILLAMSAQGASVVVSSRTRKTCEMVVQEISDHGGQAMAIPCNISRADELESLVQLTTKAYGKIDILVCNAAVNPFMGPLSKLSQSDYDHVLNTNVKNTLWLCNQVIPQMATRGNGSVIIISSIGGLRGSSNLGAYTISKAAEMQLARNLAVEWGDKNVRVNCLAPGLIRTDFSRALWEDSSYYATAISSYPLRRIGEPEDVAGAAVFLASDAAAFITGQTIVIDGGATIRGTV